MGRHGGRAAMRAYVVIADMRPICSSQGSASGIAAAIGVTTFKFSFGFGGMQIKGGRPPKSMKPEATLIPKITHGVHKAYLGP